MKNILVPTDFSNNAYNAFFHATQLVSNSECTFHLLNVYQDDKSVWSKGIANNLLEQFEEDSIVGLKNTYHRIKLDYNNAKHKINTISRKGELAKVITEIVQEENIDLVVMGNRGCSELQAIFFGSNTLNVIDSVQECPVLTVPKEIEFNVPKEIAFVTDYSHSYDAALIEPLISLAMYSNSKVRVMYISNVEELTKEQEANKIVLKKYLEPIKYSLHWMPNFSSKAGAILGFLEALEIDMLAMIEYNHTFFESITHEPVIKRVAYDLDIPFLVIPIGK